MGRGGRASHLSRQPAVEREDGGACSARPAREPAQCLPSTRWAAAPRRGGCCGAAGELRTCTSRPVGALGLSAASASCWPARPSEEWGLLRLRLPGTPCRSPSEAAPPPATRLVPAFDPVGEPRPTWTGGGGVCRRRAGRCAALFYPPPRAGAPPRRAARLRCRCRGRAWPRRTSCGECSVAGVGGPLSGHSGGASGAGDRNIQGDFLDGHSKTRSEVRFPRVPRG